MKSTFVRSRTICLFWEINAATSSLSIGAVDEVILPMQWRIFRFCAGSIWKCRSGSGKTGVGRHINLRARQWVEVAFKRNQGLAERALRRQ